MGQFLKELSKRSYQSGFIDLEILKFGFSRQISEALGTFPGEMIEDEARLFSITQTGLAIPTLVCLSD